MDNLDRIRATIDANRIAGRDPYVGLTSAEIGEYNRSVMFGTDDEAFPDEDTWSSWVD